MKNNLDRDKILDGRIRFATARYPGKDIVPGYAAILKANTRGFKYIRGENAEKVVQNLANFPGLENFVVGAVFHGGNDIGSLKIPFEDPRSGGVYGIPNNEEYIAFEYYYIEEVMRRNRQKK